MKEDDKVRLIAPFDIYRHGTEGIVKAVVDFKNYKLYKVELFNSKGEIIGLEEIPEMYLIETN